MEVLFGFGKEKIPVTFDDNNLMAVLYPNQVPFEHTGEILVRRSLTSPIGSKPLRERVKTGQKIAIVTSDITRPVQSYRILPYVLDELNKGGIPDRDITIVFALGSHRKHTEKEKCELVGQAVYDRIKCIDFDQQDCIHLGQTNLGTPVDIFRPVAEADFRICIGNIEYHYFAGYSGGMKAIMPGVAARSSIQSNHRHMVTPGAQAGRIAGNPVREDIDDAANFCAADFIVNVVLDENKEIIHCVSGHYIDAHRSGCNFLDRIYKVKIPKPADIVVVSAGGYPKDINMYQAQKALDNAQHAVKEGGVIIWVSACDEGLGAETFEKWMTGHEKSSDMISHIKQDFQLGGHKAAAIAIVLKKARIFLVSNLQQDFVKKIHLEPFADVESAMNAALDFINRPAQIIAMPYGGSTLPVPDC
jgi:nickel-dependent lactate racemase